jgi:lipopolysaccharide transport system ATP-binding protein
VMQGTPTSVISTYLTSRMEETGGYVQWTDESEMPGGEELRFHSIRLIGSDGRVDSTFEVEKSIKVEICYEVRQVLRDMRINLWILTLQGEVAFVTTDHNAKPETVKPGIYKSVCTIPHELLNVGKYIIRIDSDIPGIKVLHKGGEYMSFTTVGAGNQGSHFIENWPGVVCPKIDWQVIPMNKD